MMQCSFCQLDTAGNHTTTCPNYAASHDWRVYANTGPIKVDEQKRERLIGKHIMELIRAIKESPLFNK